MLLRHSDQLQFKERVAAAACGKTGLELKPVKPRPCHARHTPSALYVIVVCSGTVGISEIRSKQRLDLPGCRIYYINVY